MDLNCPHPSSSLHVKTITEATIRSLPSFLPSCSPVSSLFPPPFLALAAFQNTQIRTLSRTHSRCFSWMEQMGSNNFTPCGLRGLRAAPKLLWCVLLTLKSSRRKAGAWMVGHVLVSETEDTDWCQKVWMWEKLFVDKKVFETGKHLQTETNNH